MEGFTKALVRRRDVGSDDGGVGGVGGFGSIIFSSGGVQLAPL